MKMEQVEELARILPKQLREKLVSQMADLNSLQELRFRVGAPLGAVYQGRMFWVSEDGSLGEDWRQGLVVTREMVREMLEYISGYSFYAFEEEVRQGFLTVPGGHRIGLAGKAVVEGRGIRTLRHISFLNVRLAHQFLGCGEKLLPFLYEKGEPVSTLLISPPRRGKTTLLRDLVRLVSNGNPFGEGKGTSVVDERGELAACFQGVPQNDLGRQTDVLDGCPKAQGIRMMLRSMAPAVIAVDELGGEEDFRAAEEAANSGCVLLATAHGGSLEEISRKPEMEKLLAKGLFQRYILLGAGRDGQREAFVYGRDRELAAEGGIKL